MNDNVRESVVDNVSICDKDLLESALLKYGWFRGRATSLTWHQAKLVRGGYAINRSASRFLTEMGGIKVGIKDRFLFYGFDPRDSSRPEGAIVSQTILLSGSLGICWRAGKKEAQIVQQGFGALGIIDPVRIGCGRTLNSPRSVEGYSIKSYYFVDSDGSVIELSEFQGGPIVIKYSTIGNFLALKCIEMGEFDELKTQSVLSIWHDEKYDEALVPVFDLFY